MVDGMRGGRCTFEVFEHLFEHPAEGDSGSPSVGGRTPGRTRPRPVVRPPSSGRRRGAGNGFLGGDRLARLPPGVVGQAVAVLPSCRSRSAGSVPSYRTAADGDEGDTAD